MVHTYLAPSSIPGAGLGLFAASSIAKGSPVWVIAKGSPVWVFDERVDRLISARTVSALPKAANIFVERYGSLIFPDVWLLYGDDARFTNHGVPANIGSVADKLSAGCCALADIKFRDELFEDYNQFSLDFRQRGFFKG